MGLTGTFADNKGLTKGYQSLLLVAITFHGSSTPLLLSTHPLDGVGGPSFPGIGSMPAGNYRARIQLQDIDAIQWRSELGIDRVSRFSLNILDPDGFIYNNYAKVYGFRGASMIVGATMWEPGTTHFTSDCPIKFRGVCDMEKPSRGMTVITVAATTGHNMAVIKLPQFPLQNRCPLYFPQTADERAQANLPFSDWCPYAPDIGGVGNTGPANHVNTFGDHVTDSTGVFIMCDHIRSNPDDATSGCMARMGNASNKSIAPDGDIEHDKSGRHTGTFAGIQWSPGTYYAINKNYTSKQNIPTFSFLNSGILGQYATLLYGEQMVTAKSANIVESGNDTKSEAIVCSGDVGSSALTVIVNGIMLNRAPSGDPNLWWDFVNTGSRFGSLTRDTGYKNNTYQALGDPYGSLAAIRTTFYKDIFTGFGVPSIKVISRGPALWVFAPIASLSANGTHATATLPAGLINAHMGGAGPVYVFGNSLSGANGTFTANGATYGPPGTLTFGCGATGSGTGGFIGAVSSSAFSNPVWVLLDILRKCRWDIGEINLDTFYRMAIICDAPISYFNQLGTNTNHERYKCKFALETRRTAAEIVNAVLRGFNAYLYNDETTGLLCLDIMRPLADSQPAAITGSNDPTGYTGLFMDGSTGTGYVAFDFDESHIVRVGEGDEQRLDIEWIDNATVLTPNQIFAEFQDEDNQYSQDSLGDVDPDAVARAGGALQPGGALVPETLNVLGPPNFDQMSRVANTYIAERQYGNEANDPRGTRICDIGVTVEVAHLRTGHLVHLSLLQIGLVKQLFRVLKVQPTTNYESARVTLQWENEIWRTDAYGQQPQAFHSNAGTNRPSRVPLPWQPDAETPDSTIWGTGERSFQISEVDTIQGDGTMLVHAQVSGKATINQIVAVCQPPLVPLQATSSAGGGTIPGEATYLIQICAVDVGGNYSPPSNTIVAGIVASGSDFTITVGGLGWGPDTDSYAVFVGTDSFNITFQATGTGTPDSIDITDVSNKARYGPPDLVVDSMEILGKEVAHAGIIGTQVVLATASPNHVTIGAPPTGTLGDMSGRKLMLVGRPNLNGDPLPIIDFNITANTGSVITVDRDPTALLHTSDVVLISLQCTSSTASTVTDTGLANAFYPGGATSQDVGKLIRIISGTGRYQVRTIGNVTGGDTYHVTRDWDVLPDTTSIFIVEDAEFTKNSSLTQVHAQSYNITTIGSLDMPNLRARCMLVQVISVDAADNLYSNYYRSPFRLIWMFGVGGTRSVPAADPANTQLITDGTVEVDTSGVSGYTTTITADVTTTDGTTISVAEGIHIKNGTDIEIGTERLFVTAGGATSGAVDLTVDRGSWGTTPATHTSGATVNIPGAYVFQCLPAASAPNRELIMVKVSTDINYVDVKADSADTFDDGGQDKIIPDCTTNSLVRIIFPG